MNALFGLELPTPVNFVIAFVVVLALIGAVTWLVRRFGGTRLEAAARNRQPRLAVIDTAAVDGRRKLVIIRRDNVEHLLMIGGPSDVVVETNIVRAAAGAARETPPVRVNGGELPRAMPLPDTASWPLQPEPVAPPVPARPERVRTDDAVQWPSQPEQAAPARIEPVAAPAPRPAAPPPRPAPKAAPVVQIDPQTAAANDANLASMANQLEAALRRPAEAPKPAAAPAAAVQKRIEPKLTAPPAPQAAPRPAPKPAVAAAAAAPAAAKQPFESLEQEMASLLGRPGKS